MKINELVRVFVKGGIISPSNFLKIITTAEKLGSTYVQFGSRQDVLFAPQIRDKQTLDQAFESIGMQYEINTFHYQNIASSYVALDILPNKKWLTSDRYVFIMETFRYRPRLRVNIVDPSQSMVPLFTGNINFIASSQENYWYLYLRFADVQEIPWCAPFLIYTEDLPKVAHNIEVLAIPKNENYFSEVENWLTNDLSFNKQPVTEELVLPDSNFPYYEGINRLTEGTYWLGLYWRNNKFSIEILKRICHRCMETESGRISLTPWKSMVIKGIKERDRIGWEKLMGKNGMNLRHSALELNWHLPALDEEAYELKHYLVETLDRQDISTYGLTFSIKHADDMVLFTSIVIAKNKQDPSAYDILYSRDFNPNTMEYRQYAKAVNKEVLAPLLIELTLVYYDSLANEASDKIENQTIKNGYGKVLFQCKSCMTIYDETYGDVTAQIPSGTPFEKLPDEYKCGLCGSDKSNFERLG